MSVFKEGNTALITGGASGIGLAIAKLCLSHKMSVAIIDNNGINLSSAKEALKNEYPAGSFEIFKADVSDIESWVILREVYNFEKLALVVLNAAVYQKGSWTDAEYFQKTFEVNLFGYINGISTFFDFIKESSKDSPKAVVLTGSKQGITNPPGNPAYNASKAAVKSIAEQLHFDLRDTETSVHLLIPGWTFTGLSQTNEKPEGAWSSEQVAEYLYDGMKRNEFYIICPDNEVTEELDKKRILWGAGDVAERRPPLSRWREDWKDKAAEELSQK